MSTRALVRVFSAILFSVPMFAQTQAGISGVIRDASSAVIPGVTVTVTNPATNFSRSVVSNEAGVYNFTVLQPGGYNIKVELPPASLKSQEDPCAVRECL